MDPYGPMGPGPWAHMGPWPIRVHMGLYGSIWIVIKRTPLAITTLFDVFFGDGDDDGDDGDGGGRTFPAHPGPIPKACRDQISRRGNPSLRNASVRLHDKVG